MQQLATSLFSCLLLPSLLLTGLAEPLAELERAEVDAVDWWTGREVSLGEIFFPHFHFIGVVGNSTADPAELSLGGHDPQRENFGLLALEPAVSLRWGDHVEGFVVSSYVTDATGDFAGGVEEAFLKLADLPGGFELRGGRFFNRVGFQNARHSHAWDFLDQYLMNSRLLQEGELASIGGDITWHLPTRFASAVTLSAGGPPSGHDHGHGGEEGHGQEEAEFEAEGANFDDYILGANLLGTWHYNDFHQFMGSLNFTVGENEFGEDTQVFGLGAEYLWRENGLEPGGRHFRWRTEAMVRGVEAVAGPEHHGEDHGEGDEHHAEGADDDHGEDEEEAMGRGESFDEFGFYTMVAYGFTERHEASLRAEYVGGIDDFGLDERWRISPAITWSLNGERNAYLRLQYNYDHSSDFGDEHSVWLGVGINWGGAEVR